MEGPYEKGMRVRREVLGDEHVDQAVAATTQLDESFQRWITEERRFFAPVTKQLPKYSRTYVPEPLRRGE